MSQSPPSDHYYSEDIVAAILPQLPAKSLLRFHCVSKSWSTLISSPALATKQLRYNTKSLSLVRSSLALESIDLNALLLNKHNIKSNGGLPVANRSYSRMHNDLTTVSGQWEFGDIVGSCNGLICLASQDRREFRLWNPCTGVANIFPKMNFHYFCSMPLLCGFGYDCTDDYKVVLGWASGAEIEIGTIGDCLFASFFYGPNRSNSGLTICVMNEYGLIQSWAKHVQIQSLSILRPISILENGEVLMICEDGMSFGSVQSRGKGA